MKLTYGKKYYFKWTKKLKKMCIAITIAFAMFNIALGLVVGTVSAQNIQTETVKVVEPIETVAVVKQVPIVTEPTTVENKEIVSLGTYKLSAYCIENYPHICNDGDSTYTATGTRPTPGRTIAVDPDVIPYGSEVIINGHTYIAEDCGGAIKGNRIDIVFATHQEALEFGIQYAEVSYVK